MEDPGVIPNFNLNVHQIGVTTAWSLLLSVSIVTAIFRYDKIAAITHVVFGWVIFVYSFVFMLILLIPWGYNLTSEYNWVTYAHGVVGVMLFGLVSIQVGLGMVARQLQHGAKVDFGKIKVIRAIHRYLGYLMYIAYNVELLIAWYPGDFFNGFIAWDAFWIVVYIFLKLFIPKMERRITDTQTNNYICPSIGSIKDVKKQT